MKRRVVFISLGLLVLLTAALALGSVLVLRLFSLALLTVLLSYLWSRLGIKGLTAQVKKSAEYCQVGGWFDEEITVFSNSRIPKLLVNVEEETTLPEQHNVSVFSLSGKGSYSWQSRIRCRQRGRYALGTLKATVTDPFGFFPMQDSMGEAQSVIVYPATLELPFFQPLAHDESEANPSRWLVSEMGPNASRVREYASGDTLNRVHWRSTAHTGKLMVKEFDADRSKYAAKNTWIILDMHQVAQAGHGDESTEECAVTIAASLAKKYLDDNQRIGLIAAGDQSYSFPPDAESPHLWEMLEALALMKATGDVPIDQLISGEAGRFGINSVVIIITALPNERMLAPIRQARSRGATVIVISLDAVSFGGRVRATGVLSNLVTNRSQVYVVRQGDDLAMALDTRTLAPALR